MAMGRPSKLTSELIAKAETYLDHYNDDGETAVPSAVGLALFLGVSKATIFAWANKDNKDFLDIFNEIQSCQEKMLFSNGLKGKFNPTITKLMLTKHDYSDSVKQEHTGPNNGPIEWVVKPIARITDTGEVSTDTDDT